MAQWQLVHVYIPAPYGNPAMVRQVTETVLAHLYGVTDVEQALDSGWLSEISRHKEGYRRFAITLTDRKTYAPITVSFLLKQDGDTLR